MAESFTKAKLVAEIAATMKLTKADVGRVLDQLTEIAYREAANGFVVPGVCKLKVVRKKASRRRNPITGQTLLIGERTALKIVALKKAKTAIAPNTNVVIQVLDAPPPAPEVIVDELATPAEAVAQPTPPAQAPQPQALPPPSEEGQIVFPCSECGSMLAAAPKEAGKDGECPFCGAKTVIPSRTPDPNVHKQVGSALAGAQSGLSGFILFVCRACGQEIEAPTDMIGMDVECPTCGTGLTVPLAESAPPVPAPGPAAHEPKGNRSSMTIRIDLSDLE